MDTTTLMSRRSLVKGAGAVTAGVAAASALAAPAFANEPATIPYAWDIAVPESWDKTCETLVLGTGIAGCSAAIEAFDLGLDVLVATGAPDITDCSCTLSGGWLCGCGTSLQEEEGIEDDVKIFIKDVRRDGGDFGDPDVIRAWAEISGETVDWLWDLGCDMVDRTYDAATTAGSNSHSVARDYMTNPTGNGLGWMEGLKGAVEERGIEVLYETPATKLYRNAEGRVVGARIEGAEGAFDVEATKGIVVATGGLGVNNEMWGIYAPTIKVINEQAKTVLSAAPAHVNGSGIAIMNEIGAYIYPTIANYGGGGIEIAPNQPANAILLPYVWPEALVEVNANGERFNDETSFSVYFSQKPYQNQPGMWHVVVFDDEALKGANGQMLRAAHHRLLRSQRHNRDRFQRKHRRGTRRTLGHGPPDAQGDNRRLQRPRRLPGGRRVWPQLVRGEDRHAPVLGHRAVHRDRHLQGRRQDQRQGRGHRRL